MVAIIGGDSRHVVVDSVVKPTEAATSPEARQLGGMLRGYGQRAVQAAYDRIGTQGAALTHVEYPSISYAQVLDQAKDLAIKDGKEAEYKRMIALLEEPLAIHFGFANFADMVRRMGGDAIVANNLVTDICDPLIFFHEGDVVNTDRSKQYLQHSYVHNPEVIKPVRTALMKIRPAQRGALPRLQRVIDRVSPSGAMNNLVKWYSKMTGV